MFNVNVHVALTQAFGNVNVKDFKNMLRDGQHVTQRPLVIF